MSRKRVPLNQNECTANFRIGVPFEQNLQRFAEFMARMIEKYDHKVLAEIEREEAEKQQNG